MNIFSGSGSAQVGVGAVNSTSPHLRSAAFQCQLCHRTFTRRSTLSQHIKKPHDANGSFLQKKKQKRSPQGEPIAIVASVINIETQSLNTSPARTSVATLASESAALLHTQNSPLEAATAVSGIAVPATQPKSRPKSQHRVCGAKSYPCPKCDRIFNSPSHLVRHSLIHMQQPPLHCRHCKKPFRDISNKKRHERSCKLRDDQAVENTATPQSASEVFNNRNLLHSSLWSNQDELNQEDNISFDQLKAIQNHHKGGVILNRWLWEEEDDSRLGMGIGMETRAEEEESKAMDEDTKENGDTVGPSCITSNPDQSNYFDNDSDMDDDDSSPEAVDEAIGSVDEFEQVEMSSEEEEGEGREEEEADKNEASNDHEDEEKYNE